MTLLKQYISDLDTKRFGFNIAKINDIDILLNPKLKIFANKIGIKLIISRQSVENIQAINKLEAIGFKTKDYQHTFSYNLKKEIPIFQSKSFNLREAEIKDGEAIKNIAQNSFYNYGHYFSNEMLDKSNCLEVYTDWAYRSLTDKSIADHMIVAEQNEKILGFLSFKIFHNNRESFAAGGIGAVSQEARGLGVFKGINIEGLRWAKNNGIDRMEHNVLVNNYPVNNSYIGLGFKVIRANTTLHLITS
ncbi:GNAT family N-acetyltransferase [Carboxylicivirga sp. N1Y90]|uniref:GNAT family N-acetyltransferase n=1 Tax=Carboxylicivirga fragile TaxID=3417571 RepID=UPI003D336DF0|nr:GNAT family N-acetyltransferase [Marinilabiliaceae bacterium N1Y90]